MLIVESQSLDVYRNLAIEEYLMDCVTSLGPVLFVWRSDCAVVIGKNQNPWRECRLDLMRDEEVPLARRISGGGTVYHDAGNLNYCVITDRTDYREEQAFEMVVSALAPFGIRASRAGASNLTVDGLKFSGNAFAFRRGRALHHGTLLLHTDLKRLNRYLGPMLDHIQTHAIASVPASVTNLNLEVDVVASALRESFLSHYHGGGFLEWSGDQLEDAVLLPMVERQMSDEWQYGATPRFSLTVDGRKIDIIKGIAADSGSGEKIFKEMAFSLFC